MKRALVRSLFIAVTIVLGWAVVGTFFVSQDVVRARLRTSGPLDELVHLGALSVIIWMVFTPFILFFGQSRGPRGLRIPRVLVRALAVVTAFSLVRVCAGMLFVPLLSGRGIVREDWGQALSYQFHSNVMIISLLLAMRVVYDTVRAMREKERRALLLETQLTRAQLEQLRFQLQPHFLFNTINGIATLVHTSPGRADDMLMDLAALLRSTLELGRSHTIPLHRELELLDHYLRIQHMRFHDRLRVTRTVDAAAVKCPVPPLLLQPLVENSLRHVIAQRAEGGRVEVSAVRERGRLLLRVVDDGPGFDLATARLGVGVSNTIARLEQLYRGAAHIDFARTADAFTITIDLPVEVDA